MALFGLLKSKQERALDDAFKKMFSVMFPNGEQDIERDCAKVNQLTHGKIPPSDLRNFVTRCKARIHIGRTRGGGDDDLILVDSKSHWLDRFGGYSRAGRCLCAVCRNCKRRHGLHLPLPQSELPEAARWIHTYRQMRPSRPLDGKSRFERCTAAEEIGLTNRV